VLGKEAVRRTLVNERVFSQPLHGPAAGPRFAEGVPRRQQVRVLLWALVLTGPWSPLAQDRAPVGVRES
jgi:hypothetical protein